MVLLRESDFRDFRISYDFLDKERGTTRRRSLFSLNSSICSLVFANVWARQRDDEIVASLVTKLRPPLLGHALQASDQRPLETPLEMILEDVMSEMRWITDLRIDCEIAHEATERKAERTRRLAIW